MEDEVEEILGRPLLSGYLEIALLQSFEIVHAVVSEEVETKLDAFDFFHDELYDLEGVSLLVNLLDNVRLFNQDRMDELDKFVFKRKAFLPELAVEHSSVVDIELLAFDKVKSLLLHGDVLSGSSRFI